MKTVWVAEIRTDTMWMRIGATRKAAIKAFCQHLHEWDDEFEIPPAGKEVEAITRWADEMDGEFNLTKETVFK